MSSGSQSTSTASTSASPEPAARPVLSFSRASFDVAALRCSTVMFGLSSMYSSMRSSYPNSLNVATVRVMASPPASPPASPVLLVSSSPSPPPHAVAISARLASPAVMASRCFLWLTRHSFLPGRRPRHPWVVRPVADL